MLLAKEPNTRVSEGRKEGEKNVYLFKPYNRHNYSRISYQIYDCKGGITLNLNGYG